MLLKPGWKLLVEAGQTMIDIFATFEEGYDGEPITLEECDEALKLWLSNLCTRRDEIIPEEHTDEVVQMVMDVETRLHSVWHPYAIEFLQNHVPRTKVEEYAANKGLLVVDCGTLTDVDADYLVMTEKMKIDGTYSLSIAISIGLKRLLNDLNN